MSAYRQVGTGGVTACRACWENYLRGQIEINEERNLFHWRAQKDGRCRVQGKICVDRR